MKCPFCGYENIEGEDTCQSCQGDLTAIDVEIEPQSELERALLKDPISSVPPPKAVCLSPDTSIYDAAREMNKHRIGCILVVKESKLIGIVTERDILYKAFIMADQDLTEVAISTIMTPEPECLHRSDTLAYALNRMSVGGYRHIPIMKGKVAAGLLSVQNILQYITARLS